MTESALIRVIRLFCETTIAFFGLVWNILVCALLSRQTKQSYIKFYIINLALADFGLLCLSFPLAVVREQLPLSWPLGREVCLLLYPLTDVFYGVSVWTITAIAFERRRNIVQRFVSVQRSTRKSVRWIIVGIWLVSFFTVAFPLFFVMDYQENARGALCLITWSNLLRTCYVLFLTSFFYAFPLVIITITYVQISLRLRTSNRFHRSMERGRHDSSALRSFEESACMKKNAVTQRFLTPVVLTFLLTFLPLNVLRLVLVFWRDFLVNKYFFVVYNVCVVGTIVNSAANPLIYSIACKEFRTDLKKLMSGCFPFCFRSRSSQDHWTQLVSLSPSAAITRRPSVIHEQRPDPDRSPILSDQSPAEEHR